MQSYFSNPAPLSIVKTLLRTGLIGLSRQARSSARETYPFLGQVSDGVLSAPSKGLHSLEVLTERSETGGAGLIDLSIGYPSGFSWIHESLDERLAVVKEAGFSLDGYPPYSGWPRALAAVAAELHRKSGAVYEPGRELILTSGATQGASIVLEALLNPGDKVVLMDPTYLFFAYPLLIKRAKLAWVPCQIDDGNVLCDEQVLKTALKGAKILFLNSPVNPTGGIFSRVHLKRILDLAAEAGVIVLSDEIYQDFAWGKPWTSVAAFPEHRQRVIINHSYSKSLGMAGWRIGYLAAPVGLMRPILMISAMFAPYAASISQMLLTSLLPELPKHLGLVLSRLRENGRFSAEMLRARFSDLRDPSGGIFHWVSVPPAFRGSAEDYCGSLFKQCGILAMPGEHFGPSSSRKFRISFVGQAEQLREACHRLVAFDDQGLTGI